MNRSREKNSSLWFKTGQVNTVKENFTCGLSSAVAKNLNTRLPYQQYEGIQVYTESIFYWHVLLTPNLKFNS